MALPHWRGAGDVFHLMSLFSPVDRDLAVVYSPLMPVPFREALLERGYRLVEVPDEEFDSMGANVLAIAPRRCVMVKGNPVTRQRLEAAGAEVSTIEGQANADGSLNPIQQAFQDHHGLQCGFCTPGMVMSATALLNQTPKPNEHMIRTYLEGNMCRCTGYHNIIKAVLAASGQGVSGPDPR